MVGYLLDRQWTSPLSEAVIQIVLGLRQPS
jgi:hypothetical protein